MSVQVLRLSFPILSVIVSVERPGQRREKRSPADAPVKNKPDRFVRRSHPVAGMEPSLMKLQV